jgi:hypothetical protein
MKPFLKTLGVVFLGIVIFKLAKPFLVRLPIIGPWLA